MRGVAAVLLVLVSLGEAFLGGGGFGVGTPTRCEALGACRRNTKKEKRKRNWENMRKFQRMPTPQNQVRVNGKSKTLSRKKLQLKQQAELELARENAFMARSVKKKPLPLSD
mmetsp:Transcript_13539/g.44121  ORF Transcript_13539/g.44121 Transcript_13539/m.44121 type:complete len:112 (+) Transcript_13539:82-417(+)